LQQQQHDSAAKAWATLTGSTGTSLAIYNGTTARTSTGIYTLTFTVPFTTANYACVTEVFSAAALLVTQIQAKTASVVTFQVSTTAGVLTDPTTADIVCFGRQ
jgi:hypothetical protein